MKQQSRKRLLGGGIGAVLTTMIGVFLLLYKPGQGLRNWSYDLLFLLSDTHVDDVVLVYLDEESYNTLKQPKSGFDRSLHAKLLNRLKAEGAKLVVFDIFFEPKGTTTDADKSFAEAMPAFGKVVIGANNHEDFYLGTTNITFVPPDDLFREAAAGMGIVKISRDPDFSARKHFPGTELVPSLAWKAAELAGAKSTAPPDTRGEERWLNYYSQEPFRGIWYSMVASGKPLSFSFKDKYVFVGSGEVAGFTGEEKEQVRSPWTWLSGRFPVGVDIHALTFSNLLRGDWLRRWPEGVEALATAACGIVLGYSLTFFRPLTATAVALAAALAVTGLAVLAFYGMKVWFPWLIVVAVEVPTALGISWLVHSVRAYVETRLLQRSLELYLSPKQVKEILKRPDLLKPGATQKTVSLLFTDIASFSKISERMNPDDLVTLLNNYYETAIASIHETDGTVMDLVGDGIFAIWNAPQEQEDHQTRACRAALLLNEKLLQFDAASTNLPLRTRVGLHTGSVCVGNIGSSTHFDYTAIGESVNLTSRLEGLNKQLGTNVLATRDFQKAVDGDLVSRLVGHFRFRGLDQVVEIHEMIGRPELIETTRAWRDAFAEALRCFQRAKFEEAEHNFRRVLELQPDDGPSRFYLERLTQLRARPLAGDWVGEIDLTEK